MSHDAQWFSNLFDELRVRNGRAHASLLSPAAPPLRQWVQQHLAAPMGDPGGLLSTPVFEHKFGFRQAGPTMQDLVHKGLLSRRLAECMAKPPKAYRSEAFPLDRNPYTHQVAAWEALKRDTPTSVVVSAGTGAGKTECFLVPILDDLARQLEGRQGDLEGVQAIFLYPLNALINSQRERLSAWTRGFKGALRYCLYNGETRHRAKAADQRAEPERVLSRKLLRASPPPLLITNATMLEYMLVRPDDTGILQKSKKKLKYIVIDEAHTYVGSMAAELALLLRRVMNAFDVDPDDVRFIATSATLSSGEGEDAVAGIRKFLADIAGQPSDRVVVLQDERAIADLPKRTPSPGLPDLVALGAASTAERFEALCGSEPALALRSTLVEDGAHTARELVDVFAGLGVQASQEEVVGLLDLGTTAKPAATDEAPAPEAFLPLRGHIFARGIEGLWACLNPVCPGRKGSPLESPEWPFGAVYNAPREACTHPKCGGVVLEVSLCQQCGTEHLLAEVGDTEGFEVLRPVAYQALADTPAEQEAIETGDDDEASELEEEDRPVNFSQVRLVGRVRDPGHRAVGLEPRVVISAQGDVAPEEGGVAVALVRADGNRRMHCPHCGYGDTKKRLFHRSCRTGRNFVLGVSVPALLQFMKPEANPGDLPLQGRRTISFTDSRQGTARFAARSQGGAERNYVRSFIYHQVMSEQRKEPAEQERLRRELANQRKAQDALRQSGSDPNLLAGQIRALETQLDALSGHRPVRLTEVAARLSNTSSFKHLHTYWEDYLPFRSTGIKRETLAKWLVLREFARRPMRRASLETMGFLAVHFGKVDRARQPPEVWRGWAGEDVQQSWHDFLKLLLDFYVRSNSAVELDNKFFRWVGTTIRQKTVGGPGSETLRNQRISWPRFGERSRPRLGWLVVRAFGLDATDARTLQRVNDVLDRAWDFLKPVLKKSEDGRQLVMEEMELVPVAEAWICPLTRMLLDTTLCGHTPYQPPLEQVFDTRCEKVAVPHVPEPFLASADAERWLREDPVVAEARRRGALSEFGERVLGFSSYFQVTEHSAQLQTNALKLAEKQFRQGKLNLLSCSTTMEMGVDIGNLSGVAMNNAPPSPANFLQRVGRAGRRGEAAAVSLTVCRHLPHDQAVFAEPCWPFRTPMHITPVKLDSQRIVERHVRAAALTRFLITINPDQSILKLNARWFFVPEVGQTESVCDRLQAWLMDDAADAEMTVHMERLVAESALHGVPVPTLLADAGDAFRLAQDVFARLRGAILDQIERLPEADHAESPAWYALDRQRRRLDEEYLLSVLADQQVLPGYGFPTGVVPLVTATVEELKALKDQDDRARKRRQGGDAESSNERTEREDSRARLMGFPTRDLPMAVREYAPGGNVVLERRTYEPKGVTLNWHIPPNASSDSVRDVQALRTAWRCGACGLVGTDLVNAPAGCPGCAGGRVERAPYLEPAGFAVDLMEPAKMDALPAVYVQPEPPWISSGSGQLESIGRPARVQFRHAHDGLVVHLNAGQHGHGYALCLRCGRAEPETEPREAGVNAPLPKAMDGHWRLRGDKGSNWRKEGKAERCEGNESSWAIRRYLQLGGSTRTDVLEVRLFDPKAHQLVADRTLLTTIAVALRKEAARALGVDEREIGYQVAKRVIDESHKGLAILLFDTAAGGAGFCAEIPPLLPMLLEEVVKTCRCPRGCEGACHSCLLSNDTQHDLRFIDRFAVVPADGTEPVLLSPAFLLALALPDSLRRFGAGTATVWGAPKMALLQQVRRMAGPGRPLTVQLHAYGDAVGWDPVLWPARRLIRGLHDLGDVTVRLVLPEGQVALLDWQQQRQLAGLAENEGLQLCTAERGPDDGVRVWAEVEAGDQRVGFAADEASAFDEGWASRLGDAIHVMGPIDEVSTAGQPIDLAGLAGPTEGGVVELDVHRAAKGRAHGFGERFWAAVEEGASGLVGTWGSRGPADRVVYRDRYLVSPQAVHGLYAALHHLAKHGVLGPETVVRVVALASENRRRPERLGHNWADAHDQRDVLEGLLGGLPGVVQVQLVEPHDRRRTQHHRSLELSWGGREEELRLDSGFGFVAAVGRDAFPFDRDAATQVSMLMSGSWDTRPVHGAMAVPGYLLR